jgi:hypothetical protein
MSTVEDAQAEFRTIITLLTLVTAIRNEGHSVLHMSFSEGFKPIFDHTLPSLEVIASAIASLLVQNHEILACMARDGKHLTPSDPQIRGFIVIANPDHNIPHQKNQTEEYVVAEKGVSQFYKISDENWDFLNISYVSIL